MSETHTTRCKVSVELSVTNPHQSSPVLSLSQEDVIINSSLSEITKNFNFFNCNVKVTPSVALRIPTAHDFRVISKWALARTQRKKFAASPIAKYMFVFMIYIFCCTKECTKPLLRFNVPQNVT